MASLMRRQATTEGQRPYTIGPQDHRGVVMTLSVLFLLYALMVMGMRYAARARTMGMDDFIVVGATLLAIAQFATLISAVSHDFGTSYRHYHNHDASTVAKTLRAADVLFLITLFAIKAAVVMLCRRLFAVSQKVPRAICFVLIGLSGLWCLASILLITISCDSEAAMKLGSGTCSGLVTRWTIVGVLDAIIEVAFIALSVVVLGPLQITASRKLSAMACFLFRMTIVVFIGLHIYYLQKFEHSSNKGVDLTMPYVFRESELVFSLFSAALPALNQYLRKFSTTGAATYGFRPTTDGHSGGRSYGLRSLSRSREHTESKQRKPSDNFLPSQTYYQTATTTDHEGSKNENGSQDGVSMERHGSDDMIIRKDVQYDVSYLES